MSRFANMPERIARLPLDPKGFPIPWFAATVNGVRDVRVADRNKVVEAIKKHRCWICGEPLGKFLAFVIGPMCAVTRTSSEPPSHLDCATFAAINCPFLSRPLAKRRDEGLEGCTYAAGNGIKRNPGAAAVWVSKSYKTFRPPGGGMLIEIGEPLAIEWYANGRSATKDEVRESITSGMPYLTETFPMDADPAGAERALQQSIVRFESITGISIGALS